MTRELQTYIGDHVATTIVKTGKDLHRTWRQRRQLLQHALTRALEHGRENTRHTSCCSGKECRGIPQLQDFILPHQIAICPPVKSKSKWKSKMMVAPDNTTLACKSLRIPALHFMTLWTEMSWTSLTSSPMKLLAGPTRRCPLNLPSHYNWYFHNSVNEPHFGDRTCDTVAM